MATSIPHLNIIESVAYKRKKPKSTLEKARQTVITFVWPFVSKLVGPLSFHNIITFQKNSHGIQIWSEHEQGYLYS